jgi:ATP-dependent DNA helicase RecQ
LPAPLEPAATAGQDAPSRVHQPHAADAEVAALPVRLRLRYIAWLRLTGHVDRAAVLLDQLEMDTGETATSWDERCALALAQGDAAAVRSAWEQRFAISAAPSARAAYARALLELGQVDEAAAIAGELLTDHGELVTVRSLAAEIVLHQGDLSTAHDLAMAQLGEDAARVSPQLALVRVSLLAGDFEEARSTLTRAIAGLDTLTAAQTATAAALTELLGMPARAHALRVRHALLEAERAAMLAAEIDEALGRPATSANGRVTELSNATAPEGDVPTVQGDTPATQDLSSQITADEPIADSTVLATLRDVFGYESLLPGQAAIINRVLAGRDALAILPTGAGKSLTFQLPSLLLPGTTLVLSPLIALMKDQLEGLPPTLRQQTVLINSSLSPAEQQNALAEIASGRLKLVYAAPERLRQPSFLRALRQAGVSLVVVDEAHCISLWGHDFRPDYLSIPAALPELGNPPLLAMTATATPETASSLSAAFRRDLDVVRASSFRHNLFYAAERLATKEEKARRIVALCRELDGQGIVYVSSRRDAENLAGVLRDNGVPAVAYHAGLEPRLRSANQDRFMRGAARVVVATVAFGMGVNKPDVRFILHFSPSTSLEAYAQESGRAGRDGEPSRCVLLYTTADRASQTRLAQRDAMDLDTLRQVYTGIKRHAAGAWAIFDPSRIILASDLGDDEDERPDPRIGIGLLEQGRLLERHPNAPVSWTLTPARDDRPASTLTSDDAEIWQRLVTWANLDPGAGTRVTLHLQTAQVCDAVGITPDTLARILDEQTDWEPVEGTRLPCLRLLPAGENASARLQGVINDAASRARARVDRTMTYAAGRRCRHVEIAAHLGERLNPCGDACDICTGQLASAAAPGVSRVRQPKPKKRTQTTAADAETALKALATAPFPVGKTGLTRLLEGSIQSRIQADRSPFFGALADLQKSKIEAVIDNLVTENLLAYDRSREFPVLRLTPRGASAGPDEFATYDAPPERAASIRNELTEPADLDLSPEDHALLNRLRDWRRQRAAQDEVPAYVVAPNAVLIDIALRRPATPSELVEIKGFGPSRAENYGAEILAVTAGERTSNEPD